MFTKTYYLTVITITLGASTQFYSYGIVNPEQEFINEWINETYYNRNRVVLTEMEKNVIWSFVVSSVAIGAIFGAAITRTMSERFGRRNALVINGVLNVCGALLEFLAKNFSSPEFLISGRLILGINMGLASGLVPMYLMEITPNKFRGAAGTLHQVAVAFSDWFSLFIGLPNILGSAEHWQYAFAFPGVPALLLVLILPFCPESPKFTLLILGKREDSLAAVKRLVTEDAVEPMFQTLIKEAAASTREGRVSYRELFTRRDLRVPLTASILVMIAQQFTGCTAVFAFSTDMFVHVNLDIETARYATLAIGVVYFLCACTSPFLIERLGRRFLSLFQLSSCAAALTLLAIFAYIQQITTRSWASYGSILALVLYMAFYGTGSPIPWMITAELFSTKFRPLAVTVTVLVAWTFAFIISTAYLPFQQLVGVAFSYVPFIFISILSVISMYFLLPETRHKPIDDIVSEIRYRSQSISSGHPFRIIPRDLTSSTETRHLLSQTSEENNNEYENLEP